MKYDYRYFEKGDSRTHEKLVDKNFSKYTVSFKSDPIITPLLFYKLYEISKTFKSSKDYMKRLVNRLADDEFKKDSTRLAIVKQFIKSQKTPLKRCLLKNIN